MSLPEIKSFTPTNVHVWRQWLQKHHEKEDAVWLIFYKKNSPAPNITWSEAVDQAICFGWIDSLKKPIDDNKYTQYFSKRKPKSIWSKINKDKVKHLMATGEMREAGLRSVEVAKENGSWNFLNDVDNLIIPDDLEQAFRQAIGSKDYYLGLSKSVKKQLLYWVVSAKRTATRQKRIKEIVSNASKNRLPKAIR